MVYAQSFTLTYLESSKLKDAFLESFALYARLHACSAFILLNAFDVSFRFFQRDFNYSIEYCMR